MLGIDEPAPEPEVRAVTIEEPEELKEEIEVISASSAKTYMCVSTITDTESPQYNLIHSDAITITPQGFLQDEEGYYGVALGSHFGPIGSRYIFTLDTGIELPVIKVEEKSDAHTVDGFYHAIDGSVIEFVILTDTEYMRENRGTNGLIFNGNFNNCSQFKGEIVRIQKITQNEK